MKKYILLFFICFASSFTKIYAFSYNNILFKIIPGTNNLEVSALLKGASTNLVIPRIIEFEEGNDYEFEKGIYTVTSIGRRAFVYNDYYHALESITLPQSITNIDDYTFYEMYNSRSGEELSYFTSINVSEENSFFYSMDGVLYDKPITKIICFPRGKTGSYTVPDSFQKVDMSSFGWTGLRTINIPASVTEIVFSIYCFSLSAINVDTDNLQYSSIDGALYNKEQSVLLRSPAAKKRIIIPTGVTKIEKGACSYTDPDIVDIPESVNEIGDNAFSFTLPDTVVVHWSVPVSITKLVSNPMHPALPPTQEHSVFGPTSTIDLSKIVLIVPQGLSSVYQAAAGWKDFKIVEEGTGISSVPADAVRIASSGGLLSVENVAGYNLSVVDIQGRTVYSQQNLGAAEIIPNSWPSGVYAAILGKDGKSVVKKFVIK